MSETSQPHPSRRGFLATLTWLLSTLAVLALAVPLVGYVVSALRKRSSPWISVGDADSFPLQETRLVPFPNPLGQPWDGVTSKNSAYVRNLGKNPRGEDQFLVFAVNCAHLGCPVTWFPQSGLFMCPCHGGVYYENGDRASGPPPRGLFQIPWKVASGVLQIQAPHFPTLQDTMEPSQPT